VGYLGTEPQAIVDLLERHGLRLIGAFLPVVLHDEAGHDDAVASAHETSTLLETAGASFLISAVVVDLDWSPRIALADDQWEAVFDGLARLDEVAASHGLTHVTHPHWGTLVERDEDVRRVVEGSDVLLCLDTGHLALAGTDTVSLAREAGERIAHVHLKDVEGSVAERLRDGTLSTVSAVQQGLFRPLGEGSAPVAETVATLEEAGYVGWYVLEQDTALPTAELPVEEGPIHDVRQSIEFLRSLLEDDVQGSRKKEGQA
jgi:inosose dehydratase